MPEAVASSPCPSSEEQQAEVARRAPERRIEAAAHGIVEQADDIVAEKEEEDEDHFLRKMRPTLFEEVQGAQVKELVTRQRVPTLKSLVLNELADLASTLHPDVTLTK